MKIISFDVDNTVECDWWHNMCENMQHRCAYRIIQFLAYVQDWAIMAKYLELDVTSSVHGIGLLWRPNEKTLGWIYHARCYFVEESFFHPYSRSQFVTRFKMEVNERFLMLISVRSDIPVDDYPIQRLFRSIN